MVFKYHNMNAIGGEPRGADGARFAIASPTNKNVQYILRWAEGHAAPSPSPRRSTLYNFYDTMRCVIT